MSEIVQRLASEACTVMAGKLENELTFALDQLAPGWTLETVKKRLLLVIDGHGIETYFLDNVPFLEMHPPQQSSEWRGDSYVTTFTRNYRHLMPSPSAATDNTGDVSG